jgi:hypothetical protein
VITYERLEDITQCYDVREYSGRGMMGRTCLGVVTEGGQTPLNLLAEIIMECEEIEEAAYLLRHARTDSMGTETIIYWPSIRKDNENG